MSESLTTKIDNALVQSQRVAQGITEAAHGIREGDERHLLLEHLLTGVHAAQWGVIHDLLNEAALSMGDTDK